MTETLTLEELKSCYKYALEETLEKRNPQFLSCEIEEADNIFNHPYFYLNITLPEKNSRENNYKVSYGFDDPDTFEKSNNCFGLDLIEIYLPERYQQIKSFIDTFQKNSAKTVELASEIVNSSDFRYNGRTSLTIDAYQNAVYKGYIAGFPFEYNLKTEQASVDKEEAMKLEDSEFEKFAGECIAFTAKTELLRNYVIKSLASKYGKESIEEVKDMDIISVKLAKDVIKEIEKNEKAKQEYDAPEQANFKFQSKCYER